VSVAGGVDCLAEVAEALRDARCRVRLVEVGQPRQAGRAPPRDLGGPPGRERCAAGRPGGAGSLYREMRFRGSFSLALGKQVPEGQEDPAVAGVLPQPAGNG
jgi:hypothetical protein